ncbi:MAG: ABC transporter substrate-binding protein [Lachnospiraceae bacterium]
MKTKKENGLQIQKVFKLQSQKLFALQKSKGIFALLLSLSLMLAVAGCGSAENGVTVSDASAVENEVVADIADSSAAENDDAAAADSDIAGDNADNDAATATITITDMKGREITLEQPAQRIVALSPSDCEILYAIGAGDALVGRGTYCDYPAEVFDVTEVATGADTNIEQIIALDPDVLLMSDMAQTEEQVAQLEEAGIKVVISEATDIEGVYYAIDMIGTLMGKQDNAAAVISDMKETFDAIAANAADNDGKTIYFEVSPLEWGLWTAGSGTFMDEIATMMGLENCFADVQGWAEISEEQVLERNPDYILTITMYYGEGPTPEEEIYGRTGWENVTAVQNNAVLNLQNNELSRPAPRLAEGAQMLYDFVVGNE